MFMHVFNSEEERQEFLDLCTRCGKELKYPTVVNNPTTREIASLRRRVDTLEKRI